MSRHYWILQTPTLIATANRKSRGRKNKTKTGRFVPNCGRWAADNEETSKPNWKREETSNGSNKGILIKPVCVWFLLLCPWWQTAFLKLRPPSGAEIIRAAWDERTVISPVDQSSRSSRHNCNTLAVSPSRRRYFPFIHIHTYLKTHCITHHVLAPLFILRNAFSLCNCGYFSGERGSNWQAINHIWFIKYLLDSQTDIKCFIIPQWSRNITTWC